MPVYEYRCAACRKKSSVWVRSASASVSPACPHCQGTQLTRLFSTFAVRRGGSRNADEMGDGGMDDMGGMSDMPGADMAGIDEGDPRAMARMMRRMSAESSEPMDDETSSMLSRMESGEMPDDVMGGDDAGDGMDAGPGMGDED
ncbi:MAG: zinc ribbon domain-containing protein [Dehalococcoidia bacterium]|nr:zinc ribbon domain-containing protein [Dehalococcoidia bacterium]